MATFKIKLGDKANVKVKKRRKRWHSEGESASQGRGILGVDGADEGLMRRRATAAPITFHDLGYKLVDGAYQEILPGSYDGYATQASSAGTFAIYSQHHILFDEFYPPILAAFLANDPFGSTGALPNRFQLPKDAEWLYVDAIVQGSGDEYRFIQGSAGSRAWVADYGGAHRSETQAGVKGQFNRIAVTSDFYHGFDTANVEGYRVTESIDPTSARVSLPMSAKAAVYLVPRLAAQSYSQAFTWNDGPGYTGTLSVSVFFRVPLTPILPFDLTSEIGDPFATTPEIEAFLATRSAAGFAALDEDIVEMQAQFVSNSGGAYGPGFTVTGSTTYRLVGQDVVGTVPITSALFAVIVMDGRTFYVWPNYWEDEGGGEGGGGEGGGGGGGDS